MQFKCPRCEKTPLFSTYTALRKHLRMIHGIRHLLNSDIPCYETYYNSHLTVPPFYREPMPPVQPVSALQSVGIASNSVEEGMFNFIKTMQKLNYSIFAVFRIGLREVLRMISSGQLVVPQNADRASTSSAPVNSIDEISQDWSLVSLPSIGKKKLTEGSTKNSENAPGNSSDSVHDNSVISAKATVDNSRENRFSACGAYLDSAMELFQSSPPPSSEKQSIDVENQERFSLDVPVHIEIMDQNFTVSMEKSKLADKEKIKVTKTETPITVLQEPVAQMSSLRDTVEGQTIDIPSGSPDEEGKIEEKVNKKASDDTPSEEKSTLTHEQGSKQIHYWKFLDLILLFTIHR